MNKLIKILTGIIILTAVIVSMYPSLFKAYNDGKSTIKHQITKAELEPCMKYIEDNKDKLYLYEGATYCISSKTLKEKGYINVEQDYIIEVVYKSNDFLYKFNNECKEK